MTNARRSTHRLGDVCTIEGKLVDPREPQYRTLLHVGGANMVSGGGGLTSLRSAEEEGLISGKHLFTEEDVLYSKIRPRLQKVATPPFCGLCSADVYPLRPKKERIDRDYLFYLLLSSDFTNHAILSSNRAGMPKVNREQLFSYTFELPSLAEQHRIAARMREALDCIDEMRRLREEALKETQALRSIVFHKAFAGEL